MGFSKMLRGNLVTTRIIKIEITNKLKKKTNSNRSKDMIIENSLTTLKSKEISKHFSKDFTKPISGLPMMASILLK